MDAFLMVTLMVTLGALAVLVGFCFVAVSESGYWRPGPDRYIDPLPLAVPSDELSAA
jgi:hypothetical protein